MHIKVSIFQQQLILLDEDRVVREYFVSTAKNGVGEKKNSECTPQGKHIITEKIGYGARENSVFVGRAETNELYKPELRNLFPERDYVHVWDVVKIVWFFAKSKFKKKICVN